MTATDDNRRSDPPGSPAVAELPETVELPEAIQIETEEGRRLAAQIADDKTRHARKPMRTLAVQNAKVNRLGLTTLIRRNILKRNLPNRGRRSRMNVFARAKRREHFLVTTHGRHHAQLNLRIITREQRHSLFGHKRMPNPPP